MQCLQTAIAANTALLVPCAVAPPGVAPERRENLDKLRVGDLVRADGVLREVNSSASGSRWRRVVLLFDVSEADSAQRHGSNVSVARRALGAIVFVAP